MKRLFNCARSSKKICIIRFCFSSIFFHFFFILTKSFMKVPIQAPSSSTSNSALFVGWRMTITQNDKTMKIIPFFNHNGDNNNNAAIDNSFHPSSHFPALPSYFILFAPLFSCVWHAMSFGAFIWRPLLLPPKAPLLDGIGINFSVLVWCFPFIFRCFLSTLRQGFIAVMH